MYNSVYMNRICLAFLIAVIFINASCTREGTDYTAQADSAVQWLESFTSENLFEGTLIVGDRDSIYHRVAVGTADRVWNIPMELDYPFDIASLNKSFIAGVTLILAEEGRLSLDQVVTSILPEFKGKYTEPITIHQLLCHTSGIPDYDAIADDLKADGFDKFKRMHFTNEAYAAFISELEPLGPPGKQFYYSNFGYHLLAVLLETISGKHFNDLLEEKVCRPLGLQHTFAPRSNTAVYANTVEAYNFDEAAGTYSRNQYIDFSLGRRIYASAPDLYTWAQALCKPGDLLSEASLQKMKTNHIRDIDPGVSYGYGWYVFDGGDYGRGNLGIDREYIIHGGSTDGFKSMLTIVENCELIVTHLSNIGRRTNEFRLTRDIVQSFYGE